ncbi:cytochrome P450 [Penicillium canescens]|uniref:Cytochrome P450 n=1 Tax=Penicillium canescens TaxID=5083 RepID=A0AAD6I1Y5_PENCN|nr:cytochrome P450 [Penicillium canescens]
MENLQSPLEHDSQWFPRVRLYIYSAVFIYVFGQIWVYPTFVSPLRHLPTIKYSLCALKVGYDRRRPLQWMRTLPNSGLIHIYDSLLGVGFVFPTTYDATKDVLNNSTGFEKPPLLRRILSRILGDGLVATEGLQHQQYRRLQNPAFAAKNVRQLHDIVWAQATLLLQQLQQQLDTNPQPVNLSDWAHRFSLDTIALLATGHNMGVLVKPNKLSAMLYSATEPSISKLCMFFTWVFTPRLEDTLHSYFWGVIRQAKLPTLKVTTKHENQYLLSAVLGSPELSDEEKLDQLLTTVFAGNETSNNAIVRCCDLLCRNPALQERLRDEIRAFIPSPSQKTASADQVESLSLLHGVVEEVLRLYPTIPTTLRVALHDTCIQGMHIPKGTNIVVDFHGLNRDRAVWGQDADAFKPERWLDGDRRLVTHHGQTHLSFSSGAHNCIGREVARATIRCVIVALVGRFVMELVHPEREIQEAGASAMRSIHKVEIKLKPIEGW